MLFDNSESFKSKIKYKQVHNKNKCYCYCHSNNEAGNQQENWKSIKENFELRRLLKILK